MTRSRSRALKQIGLSLANQGDIDTQAIAGALSTGTHGTGIGLGCLSSQAVGMRLVQPDGSVCDVDADRDPETMAAAQVSIGMLGVISTITLQAVSAYNLKETLWREDFESCMERHDDLAANNRHFSFFWYPVAESRRLYCRRTSKCGPQIRPVISCRMAVVCKVRSNLNVEPLSCLVPCIGADGACSGVPTPLLSAEFAGVSDVETEYLGEFELKGIAEKQLIYGLKE